MSAINFPLSTDISSAANQVSSQNAEQLPTGGSGQSAVLQPETVTLSAVFPPAPPVSAANFVQFQSPAPAAPEAFRRLRLKLRTDQLAHLNRVLEQLGINPQSISLDNRLALIKSANDPPALLNLVRTLGVLNQATTSANNLSNPAPIGNQIQGPAQNESQAQPQPPSTAPLQSSSQPSGSGFGSTVPGAGGASSSADQAALASNAAAQFQELQAVFQGAGNAQNSSASGLDILARRR